MNDALARPGPLLGDVEGTQLTAADRELPAHPAVGGAILFTHNDASCARRKRLHAACGRTPGSELQQGLEAASRFQAARALNEWLSKVQSERRPAVARENGAAKARGLDDPSAEEGEA